MRILLVLFTLLSLNLPAQVTSVSYTKADSIAFLYPDHSLQNLWALSMKLTGPLETEEEKFRAIYRWVCENVENDYYFYAANKRNRERWNDNPDKLKSWNNDFTKKVFKKLLNDHSTVCTGYAYLIKELAYHAGIEAVIIDGYGRTAEANIGGKGLINHSWNAVKLNNTWFLCDATWSSGHVDPGKQSFIRQYSEAYFLTPPELFVRNHYPADTAWSLLESTPSLEAFLNRPLIYKHAIQRRVIPLQPDIFKVSVKKGEKVAFRFRGPENFNSACKLQLVRGKYMKEAEVSIVPRGEGIYSAEYTFSGKGEYVVHFLMDNNHVFSYEVKVE